MSNYLKILAAVDFSENCEAVIARAFDLAGKGGGEAKVLHVVDYALPLDNDYILPPTDEIEVALISAAAKRLDRLQVAPSDRAVMVGRPKLEILRYAQQIEADLIVIGAHGHHGIVGMLGSTTDRIVHRAHCDVLVVR